MRVRAILATAAVVTAPLAGISFATAAHAAPTSWTATTALTNLLDYGYGGDSWASDTTTRTATITLTSATGLDECGDVPKCYEYTGTIRDTGTAHAIAGVKSPGASAVAIKGTPSASIAGGANVTFFATSNTPDAKLVPAKLSGNSEDATTWLEQFFAAGTTFGDAGPDITDYSWVYTDLANCQTWVDSSTVPQASSGDITGADQCPVLSAGKAVTNGNGATVTWKSSEPADFKVTLSGPGPENGRTGTVTVPKAAFSGLEHNHTYSVKVQPLYKGHVTGKAGVVMFVTK